MPLDLIIAGFERALIGFRDSNGIATGQQSTLANGASSGAYVLPIVRTASFEPLAPVNLNVEGGDILYTILQFGNSKTMPFDLVVSDYDHNLIPLITGATVNTTNTQVTVTSDNPARSSPRIMWMALQSRATDAVTGQGYYVTKFLPSCQLRLKRKGPGFQALSDVVINVTPQMVNKALSGQDFTSTANMLNLSLQGNRTDNYDYVSNNPIHVMSFRQDGAATTFTTTYTPISTVVTLNATPNEFHINGVPTALTSLSGAGLATLAAAGSAAVADSLFYEANY